MGIGLFLRVHLLLYMAQSVLYKMVDRAVMRCRRKL